MRADWEPEPTVEGVIVHALSSPIMGDAIHVSADDVAPAVFNLKRLPSREASPNAPFFVVGDFKILQRHGLDPRQAVGRKCHIYANDRLDLVSIEGLDGEMGDTVIWARHK